MILLMTEDERAELVELARNLNRMARSVVEEEGEHAAMFFLRLASGEVEANVFSDSERPVGEARAREMADAVRSRGAVAIAFVSEAWSARPEDVPKSGGAGDAADALDVLLVAAVDRLGNTVALETPLFRSPDRNIELGESKEYAGEYQLNVMDKVRAVWGLDRA
jgi:hypothetical protein